MSFKDQASIYQALLNGFELIHKNSINPIRMKDGFTQYKVDGEWLPRSGVAFNQPYAWSIVPKRDSFTREEVQSAIYAAIHNFHKNVSQSVIPGVRLAAIKAGWEAIGESHE